MDTYNTPELPSKRKDQHKNKNKNKGQDTRPNLPPTKTQPSLLPSKRPTKNSSWAVLPQNLSLVPDLTLPVNKEYKDLDRDAKAKLVKELINFADFSQEFPQFNTIAADVLDLIQEKAKDPQYFSTGGPFFFKRRAVHY